MRIVDAHFELLTEVSIDRVFGEVGVYVIWDSQARVRPTYIGEGVIIERLSSQVDRVAFPVRGYIAILDYHGPMQTKKDAEIVEAVLLEIGDETDRYPRLNSQRGSHKQIKKVLAYDNTLRVKVSGYDPFMHPRAPRPIEQNRWVTIYSQPKAEAWDAPFCDDRHYSCWTHPWRWRRHKQG